MNLMQNLKFLKKCMLIVIKTVLMWIVGTKRYSYKIKFQNQANNI